MDRHTIQGISLFIFALGVILANIVGEVIEHRRSLKFKRIRQDRRGSNEK